MLHKIYTGVLNFQFFYKGRFICENFFLFKKSLYLRENFINSWRNTQFNIVR